MPNQVAGCQPPTQTTGAVAVPVQQKTLGEMTDIELIMAL